MLSAIKANYFPEAVAISYIYNQVIIELRLTSDKKYKYQLKSLPYQFALPLDIIDTDDWIQLRYHNGPIHGEEFQRSRKPDPTNIDGPYDDTDYIQARGYFNPGCLISSKNDQLGTAGILLQKGNETRLTVPIHAWAQQLKTNVKLGDDSFLAKQGEWSSGTPIGPVVTRIGESDIGLVKTKRAFINRFLDIKGTARSLLASSQITKINEIFLIDSFITGRQRLLSVGVRVVDNTENSVDELVNKETIPEPGTYIQVIQGIYSVTAPEIKTEPQIRAGVCGAAVIRARQLDEAKNAKKTEVLDDRNLSKQVSSQHFPKKNLAIEPPKKASIGEEDDEETTGEVAGFMHWSDISLKNNPRLILCFADSVDGLIADGWAVAQKFNYGRGGLRSRTFKDQEKVLKQEEDVHQEGASLPLSKAPQIIRKIDQDSEGLPSDRKFLQPRTTKRRRSIQQEKKMPQKGDKNIPLLKNAGVLVEDGQGNKTKDEILKRSLTNFLDKDYNYNRRKKRKI